MTCPSSLTELASRPTLPGTMRPTRRAFLTGSFAVLAAPLGSEARQAGKVWRIGVLSFTRFPGEEALRIEAFRQGLRDLGYVEGRDLAIEYRYSDGKDELLPALAVELVRL